MSWFPETPYIDITERILAEDTISNGILDQPARSILSASLPFQRPIRETDAPENRPDRGLLIGLPCRESALFETNEIFDDSHQERNFLNERQPHDFGPAWLEIRFPGNFHTQLTDFPAVNPLRKEQFKPVAVQPT